MLLTVASDFNGRGLGVCFELEACVLIVVVCNAGVLAFIRSLHVLYH